MSDFVTESSRCLQCKNPSCVKGCPLHNNIPKFLALARKGDFDGIVEVVGHPFGEVCGYICPKDKQCKGSCVLAIRGVGVDAGVVEREAFANSYPKFLPCDSALSHLNVAVIGGGVSGVTFAQQCIKHGANVNIYERTELLHTLTSIPEFRLPRETIDRIVSAVKSSKINVIKQDVTFADVENLRKQFDVVYLSTGVMLPNKMHIDGEEYAVSADEFLRSKPLGKAVVVGGGNTAIDCARKNVRAGFETVIARHTYRFSLIESRFTGGIPTAGRTADR